MTARDGRGRRLRELHQPFDMIVVGGGVNGCGAAWDAALRGLRVLLVERDDLGSGTSSWSSRLIHGGLKYLEKLDVRLVRESLREREWLLNAAPHLVHPLRMVMPIYRGAKNGPATLWAGMAAYDALSWDKSVPHHSMWSRRRTLRSVPALEHKGLIGAATFFDGQAELAERLCVEVAVAAQANGATVLTHASVDGIDVRGGRVTGVRITDGLTGESHRATARAVLNMAGPRVDEVLLGTPAGERLIGGTKGSHFVLERFDGAPESDALYYEGADGRPMMLMPWQGQCLIGSTDLRFKGSLDSIGPSREEVDYVLRETNRVVPGARLSEADLLWGYTGVRPLPYTAGGETGDISRRHDFHDHGPEADGLVSLVGGKLTTFRQVGEEATDLVLRKLGRAGRRSVTRRMQLPGAGTLELAVFADAFAAGSGLPAPVARRLVALYGTRAGPIADRAAGDGRMREVVDEATGLLAAEIAFVMEEELAMSLTDVLARRTMVGIGPTLADASVDRAAEVAATVAGWSEERTARELETYRSRLSRFAIPRASETGAETEVAA